MTDVKLREQDALTASQYSWLKAFWDAGGYAYRSDTMARIVGDGADIARGRGRANRLVRMGYVRREGRHDHAQYFMSDKGKAALRQPAPEGRNRYAPAGAVPDVLRPEASLTVPYAVESMAVAITGKYQCRARLEDVRAQLARFFFGRSTYDKRHVPALAAMLAECSWLDMSAVEIERVLHEGLRRAESEVCG